MAIKTNFFYLSVISLLAPALFNPNIANADPKTDISNYEAAADNGDINKAIELGEIAFTNAKRDLDSNNPYIAKIGFDLANLYIQNNDDKSAYAPISTALKLLQNNPNLAVNSDMKQVEAIYAISLFAIEGKDNEKYKLSTVKLLENAVKKLPHDFENSEYAVRINYDLSIYYSKQNDWANLSKYSNDLVKSIFIAYPNDVTSQNKYLFLGYSLRGTSTFVANLRSANSTSLPQNGKLLSDENTPLYKRTWADALADIRRARKIYGPKKNSQDSLYFGLMAWDTLIGAYSTQIFNSSKISIEYDKRINSEINTQESDYTNIEEAKNDKICENKIKYKYQIFFSDYMIHQYNFASTIAIFDIGDNNLPTNIRILASIPNIEFGKLVESGIKNAKLISIEPNTPSYCLKDYVLKVRFVVN